MCLTHTEKCSYTYRYSDDIAKSATTANATQPKTSTEGSRDRATQKRSLEAIIIIIIIISIRLLEEIHSSEPHRSD
jgi:hypothetical protein